MSTKNRFHVTELPSILALCFLWTGCGESPNTEPDLGDTEVEATGGISASGGSSIGTGGTAMATGGSTLGPSTGGNLPTSGGASSGGQGGAGSGGQSSGGTMQGTGGAESTGGAGPVGSETSAGCGVAADAVCDTSGSPCTIDIDGTERKYYVVLPDGYDPETPYPVVFQFHPLGGNAEQGMTMYNIRPNFPEAIYVTPDGLQSGSFQGWSNTGGEDEQLTRAIVQEIESKYCIDRSRYFSTGFSFGGSMSYTAALCMSDIFRAIGAMAGAPISGAGDCTPERPVAAWINHGTDDTALPITMSEPLRDELVEKNGCSSTTHAVEPAPCVAFDECDEGFPVIWCEQEGVGHAIPNYSPTAIGEFFKQF